MKLHRHSAPVVHWYYYYWHRYGLNLLESACPCFITGKGANVILDCIGGKTWEQNVSCLATDGRWVLYGTMGGRRVEGELFGKLLSKRGHLLCSLLRSRSLQVRNTDKVMMQKC